MNADEKTRVRNLALALRWLGLALPILLICALCIPWLFVLAGIPIKDVGIANSFVRRLFASPGSYKPILLAVLAITSIAVWPGKSQHYRSLLATGMFWGLGLAVSWGFDGGLGTVLLTVGTGVLYFGAMDYGLRKLTRDERAKLAAPNAH